jgi:hypothetical protein
VKKGTCGSGLYVCCGVGFGVFSFVILNIFCLCFVCVCVCFCVLCCWYNRNRKTSRL